MVGSKALSTLVVFSALTGAAAELAFLDNFNGGDYEVDPNYAYFDIFGDGTLADDGVTTQGNFFVRQTAEPFTFTLPQLDAIGLERIKSLQYNVESFETDGTVKCTLRMSAKTFKTEDHPFGDLVTDPEDDWRLATVGMNTLDLGTLMVADFFLTNKGIWALYERLPFSEEFQTFAQIKRVADRQPDDIHNLSIEYDKPAGEFRYFVGDMLKLTVGNLGFPTEDMDTIFDYGGEPTLAEPEGLDCGWGMFTVLDAPDPFNVEENEGLVKLSSTNYDFPTNFFDEESLVANRLWGQGAEVTIYKMKVETKA